MAAARYWRLVGIEAFAGGDLELSEIAMFSDATRIDGAATLTCSHTPVAGALADLKDASMSVGCRFAAANVRAGGFYLQWDFGSAVDVSEFRFGAATVAARFVSSATITRSADAATWAYADAFAGAVYPGAGQLTTSVGGGVDVLALPQTSTPPARTPCGRVLTVASAAVGAHRIAVSKTLMAKDVEWGGNARIWGTTKAKGTPNVPTKARVVLLHQRSKLPVRETWSDPVTGAFVFAGIDTSQQFLALAEDAEGHFRPVAANRLTPEVLT